MLSVTRKIKMRCLQRTHWPSKGEARMSSEEGGYGSERQQTATGAERKGSVQACIAGYFYNNRCRMAKVKNWL